MDLRSTYVFKAEETKTGDWRGVAPRPSFVHGTFRDSAQRGRFYSLNHAAGDPDGNEPGTDPIEIAAWKRPGIQHRIGRWLCAHGWHRWFTYETPDRIWTQCRRPDCDQAFYREKP